MALTPEILAKILGIIAKTGERVIVIDPVSGVPFTVMSLTEYERMVEKSPVGLRGGVADAQLTSFPGSGMIDPDVALLQEAAKGRADWGGDEEKEEDRYYMEPAE